MALVELDFKDADGDGIQDRFQAKGYFAPLPRLRDEMRGMNESLEDKARTDALKSKKWKVCAFFLSST